MLLAIDVGNTQTVIGLFGPEDPDNKEGDLIDHWRIVTVAERTSDELALLLRQFLGWHGVTPTEQRITGIAISSVVPSVTANLRQMSERHFGVAPCVIEPMYDSTTPAPSLCGMTRGNAILRVRPARVFTSDGLTPEVFSRTRTSPGPACGDSTSPTCRTSAAAPFFS